jgi:WD40 repeat protein
VKSLEQRSAAPDVIRLENRTLHNCCQRYSALYFEPPVVAMSSGEGEETVLKLLPHLHRGRASPVRQQFREGVVPLAGSDWQSPKQAGTQEVSVEVVFGHNDQVFEMIVVDGNRLVTVSHFRIRIWTFPPLECLHQIDPNYDDDPRTRLPQGTIAARPRQKQAKHFFTAAAAGTGILLVGSADGSVRIYDPKSGKRRFLMEPFVDPKHGFERAYKDSDPKVMAVRCASVLASKNIGVTGCERSEIRIWDCEWGDLLWLLRGHAGTVQMLVIREDMLMLSASDGENIVRVWNLNDLAPLESDKSKGTLIGNTKPVVRAALYDDVWVTGGSDFSVRLYDPVTYIEKKTLLGHVKSITQIQRRDERSLVTSGADGYIRVWELKTGRQVVTLSGHHFHIVGFYLDGKYAVSGSLDGSLRVWDIVTSRTLSVINVGSSSEPMFALTRVSKTRFIGSFPSGIMKMWDISSVLATDQQDNYPVIRQCVGPGARH